MPLPSAQETALTRTDARSDDHRREIAFRGQSVVIARRVAGIAMRVRVPLASYRGVALSLTAGGSGEAVHKVELIHRDPDLSIELCEGENAAELAAEWNAWAQSLSLPRLFEGMPGGPQSSEDRKVLPGPRRRGSLIARRRTRFARRRKMGALQRLATAHRDEREIICYE
jgi:Family of unknown function (DUF6101)